MNIDCRIQTTEHIIEFLNYELQVAKHTIEGCMKHLTNDEDPKWIVDDLQKARAMKIEALKTLKLIEKKPEASFEDHVNALSKRLIGSLVSTMGYRNLMNSTSNASNMADLHELTAKASLASSLFDI